MDAFIQQNSWIFSKESPFCSDDPDHRLVESTRTGIGWLRTLEKNRTFPVFNISVNGKPHHWIAHNAVADIRGSRRRLECNAYKTFARLIPHDINGKMMGIDGVIDYWKEAPLDTATAVEDLQSIRTSLSSVSQLGNTLGWLSKDGEAERRVFTLKEIHSALAPILPRLCKPSTSFIIPPPEPAGSLLCSPHIITFWSLATASLLASAKGPDEKITFSWGSDTTIPSSPALQLSMECELLSEWLEGQSAPEDGCIQLFYDWLVVLAYVKGSVSLSGSKIQITIPLVDLVFPGHGKILCIGHPVQENSLSPECTIFVEGSVQAFADAFSERLFSPTVIFLSPSISEEISGIIQGIARSVDEATLLIR